MKAFMMAKVLGMSPKINIRRVRRLPIPGNVLVHKGQNVNPEDVIAEANVPGKIFKLDLARGLGLAEDEVGSCLVRKIGEDLEAGDIVAQVEGTFPRLVRTPIGGQLVDYHDGQAVLATGTNRIVLQAEMIGEVEEVIPEYGVVVHCLGSLIQGVWGNGKIGIGELHADSELIVKPLELDDVDLADPGQILAAGACFDPSSLARLSEKTISGLVLGVLAPQLLPDALALPFPVVLLQGVGGFQPDPKRFELLITNTGKMALVNADQGEVFGKKRPEVIIPLDEGDTLVEEKLQDEIAVGQQVMMLSGRAVGRSGEVLEMPEKPVKFQSGLICQSAVIRLSAEETVTVPIQNLIIFR